MASDKFTLNVKYKTKFKQLPLCEYEVVKKNKVTCWVRLWKEGKRTDTIYKNVRYSILAGD